MNETPDLFEQPPAPVVSVRPRPRDEVKGKPAAVRVCECCGQAIRKLNPHRMDRQKVAMLEILAKAFVAGHEWVKVTEGEFYEIAGVRMRGPYRGNLHAMRLVWFGLAEHGERRSGLYRVTPAGMQFLRGRGRVPAAIYCKDGEVVERDEAMIDVGSVKGVILDKKYWDDYWIIQRYPSVSK